MCAVTKVANTSGLVTATLSQLAQTISVEKNNYTKRKGDKVTILTCIKQKRQKNRWMDGWMDGQSDGRMDGWMDGWMDEQMDAQMDEQIDRLISTFRS